MIGAVRMPQLSKEFLIKKVQENQFVKGSEHCMEMVTKAMDIHLDNSSNAHRSSFLRNTNEIYVFPFGNRTQMHITNK